MAPRTGRPPKDGETKGERITFRANELDLERIEYCQGRSDSLSKSEIIRYALFHLYWIMKKREENEKE